MSVLLLGKSNLEEFELLSAAVERRGSEAIFCDVTDWPGDTPVTYRPDEATVTLDADVDLDDISGVYALPALFFQPLEFRFHESLSENLRPTLNQLREHRAIFESVCYTLEERNVNVVPPLRQFDWHDRKPWQMTLCNDEDVPVPDTLFTNSPDEVVRFYEEHDRVIYKPVTQGASPKRLTDEDLTDSRLDDLATSPIQFQEFAPGDDLRVFFLEGEVIGGIRYASEQFSFKLDIEDGKEIDVEPLDPSDAIKVAVERVAKASELPFGAVDVRREPNGEFKVLELNEVPRFAAADLDCGQDVAGKLADYLLDE